MVLETIAKNDGKSTSQVIPFSLGTITISACYGGWGGHNWDISYKGVTKRLHLTDVLSFPGFTIKVLSDSGNCTVLSPATFQIQTGISTTGTGIESKNNKDTNMILLLLGIGALAIMYFLGKGRQ